jgi:hypothetical protein
MNLAKVEKYYSNLTVDERARMMMSAHMRNDESEVKKLVSSAERKNFTIRANDESDICEAWHKAHLILISLNAESHIKELKCALTCLSLATAEDKVLDEDLAERAFNLELFYRQGRKVTLLAFHDWIEKHSLPFENELLEVCGVEMSLLDSEDKNEIRKHQDYIDAASVFTNIWCHR